MLYAQFSIPTERRHFIKKIDKGDSRVKNPDPEVEKFMKDFLTNWKTYKKETRMEFCNWIIDTGTDEGFDYANAKKEELKASLGSAANKPKELAKKVAQLFKDEDKGDK